jgi:CDP-glucose 4,6-dehydratase
MEQWTSTLESVEMKKEFWEDKRVFITGATGFIGSWLTKTLVEQGGYVVTLVRDWDPQTDLIRTGIINRVHVVGGTLEDYATLERAINEHEIDTVFHLGAQTIVTIANRSPLPTFEANIRGGYNLLEACRVHKDMVKRVVVASSDKAYGDSDVLPYTEEMPPLGRHPYDVSKSCMDLLAQAYWHTYQLPVGIARCGNVYGGGDLNWSRIIPGTIRSIIENQAPVIRSDGTFVRDYVYVEDVVGAYINLAKALDWPEIKGGAFNFSFESPMSVIEIVNVIRHLMGREDLEPIILNKARAEIKNQYLSSAKARKLLGWKPRYILEEGLRKTIAWYREFLGDGNG